MSQPVRKTEHFDIRKIEKEVARVAKAYDQDRITRQINKQIRRQGGQKKGTLVLLEENEKWVTRAIKKEQANKKALNNVSPEQWLERIKRLEEPLRTKVCFLLWWNFFSRRRVTRRWPHLDHILASHALLAGSNFTRNELVIGLCIIGFTPYEASKRISESIDE